MRSYMLFKEFCEKTIYGENPSSALMFAGGLHKPGVCENNTYTPGPVIFVTEVLGRVDTADRMRGSNAFIRMIVKNDNNRIIEVDMVEGPEVLDV